jgi:hypothetical protein
MSPETKAKFEAEEQAYWSQRDQILHEHIGKLFCARVM